MVVLQQQDCEDTDTLSRDNFGPPTVVGDRPDEAELVEQRAVYSNIKLPGRLCTLLVGKQDFAVSESLLSLLSLRVLRRLTKVFAMPSGTGTGFRCAMQNQVIASAGSEVWVS